MYYGQRDKIISIRVSSELLAEAQKRIDSYTKVYDGRGERNWYSCNLPGSNSTWGKLTLRCKALHFTIALSFFYIWIIKTTENVSRDGALISPICL